MLFYVSRAFRLTSFLHVFGIFSVGGSQTGRGASEEHRAKGDVVTHNTANIHVDCGVTTSLTYSANLTSYMGHCRPECPYRVEDTRGGGYCKFQCVSDWQACEGLNPNTTVPDKHLGICRRCHVEGCDQCLGHGTDTCGSCMPHHDLVNGKCRPIPGIFLAWHIAFAVLCVLAVLVAIWLIDLGRREVCNHHVLKRGLRFRSRSKLRQAATEFNTENIAERGEFFPESGVMAGKLWPLTTNLIRKNVAGPGIMLYFNFQVAVIVWALLIAVAWHQFGLAVDNDFLLLGTRSASTPWQYCVLIEWGHQVQQDLMWSKSCFVYGVYIFSFLGSMWFSVQQLQRYEAIDNHSTTMKDYVAVCYGLPKQSGSEPVEREIKERIEQEAVGKVIGVSCGWEYSSDVAATLTELLKDDLEDFRERRLQCLGRAHSSHTPGLAGEPQINGMQLHSMRDKQKSTMTSLRHNYFLPFERQLLGTETKMQSNEARVFVEPDHAEEMESFLHKDSVGGSLARKIDEVTRLVQGLTTSSKAVVVFDSARARDEAVACIRIRGGMSYKGRTIRLKTVHCEPGSVIWENFGKSSAWSKIARHVFAFFEITMALAVWTLFFYMPYAYFVLGTNYKNGTQPGFIKSTMLSLVVVIGNTFIYKVCEDATARLKFQYIEHAEAAYLLLYFVAVMFNVIIDLYVTYMTAYDMMVAANVRTYDGTLLAELSLSEAFETYALQRELGNLLWVYAYPATYLVPFVIEPFASTFLPRKLMELLVGAHPDVSGRQAEEYMSCPRMDLSRYGDILVNVQLAVLMFFLPEGYTLRMYAALGLCHIFIYVYDHYRVLRAVTSCSFATKDVDFWAQMLLSIPCATILSCGIFKSVTAATVEHDVRNCVVVFVMHVICHCVCLVYIVPSFSHVDRDQAISQVPYKTTASRYPCSFFNTNPVHCLRSKLIFKHSPPCRFFAPGKEHLLEVNEDAHCFYGQESEAEAEDFTSWAGNRG